MTTAVPTFTLLDRLVKARHHAGLNQADIAEQLGISRSTVRRVESGAKDATRMLVMAWAITCDVPLDWLETGGTESEAE